MVKNNRHQSGLIDKTGAFIIPPEYDEIIMLGENRAAIGKAYDSEAIFLKEPFMRLPIRKAAIFLLILFMSMWIIFRR